jgi:hypothetical protein
LRAAPCRARRKRKLALEAFIPEEIVSNKFALLLLATVILLAACAPGQIDADAIATGVAATLAANAEALPTAEQEAQPLTGIVEGTICFPSQGIPPMSLFLQPAGGAAPVVLGIGQDQISYSAELFPGAYTAYAWLPDFSFGGSYSQAVSCGLTAECTDHSLIEFQVTAGATTSGVDLCDWYGNPGSVPLPPGVEAPASTGAIAGTLIYPSEYIPAMNVVAFSTDSADWFMVVTQEGESTFQIDDLPSGQYYVVAYVLGEDFGGGYTPAVACGLSVDCPDHSLIPVNVQSGEVATDVHPHDWYAGPGSYPPNPAP